MLATLAVVAVIAWAAIWASALVFVRHRAEIIEHSSAPKPEKVHSLQRLSLMLLPAMLVSYVIGWAAAIGLSSRAKHQSSEVGKIVIVASVIAIIIIAFVAPLLAGRTLRPALARVRDVPRKNPDRRRYRMIGLAVMAVYLVVLVGGVLLIPHHGTGAIVGLVAVYVFAILVTSCVVMPLLVARVLTQPMSKEHRRRLQELASDMGVRVHDFRVLKGRSQKVGNAFQIGTLPGLRYVVVTDYLTDHLTERELDAVVAHELGHARRHHGLIKMGTSLGLLAILELAAVAAGSNHHSAPAAGLAIAGVVVFPVALILVRGLVGVRLERAADDAAAAEVGSEDLADALRKLGEVNDTKFDTGRAWSIFTQHPGIDTRLARLGSEAVPAKAA
ncbi:MAG TPA: M48 family metalloprotease [Ilumatobacteraceae bacterium]